jgi:hypothetical protein
MHERPRFREADLARHADRPDAPGPLAMCRPELARRNLPGHAWVPRSQQDEARIVVVTELDDLSDNIPRWLALRTPRCANASPARSLPADLAVPEVAAAYLAGDTAGILRHSRASVGGIPAWGVSPVCGDPTFQIRIVVPVCACGVTKSSTANAVHANVRNMRASVVQ